MSIPCGAPLCHPRLTKTPDISTVQDFSAPLSKTGDNNFRLKPILLNPGDEFTVLVFVSDEPRQVAQKRVDPKKTESASSTEDTNQGNENRQEKGIPNPIWNARIVNISDLKFAPNYEQKREAEVKDLGIFYTIFYHAGWSVYRFALLVFILFISGLFFGTQFGILRKNSPLYYIFLSALMGLSVVAGDNIASRIKGVNEQPLVSNVSSLLYFLLIGYFTLPAVKKTFQKKSASINNP